MSDCSASAQHEPLLFSHQTALQLVRDRRTSAGRIRPNAQPPLPESIPSDRRLRPVLIQLGLPDSVPAHLTSAAGKRRRTSRLCTPHTCSQTPDKRFALRLAEKTYAYSPDYALAQIAAREPNLVEILLNLWEACGTYGTSRTALQSAYNIDPLTSKRSLASFVSNNPSAAGARKLERALRYLANQSASPRETHLALLLGLPLMYGGYGLGIPQMNYTVEASAQARTISGKRSFRCDLCWPEAKIDVEYQSTETHSGEQRRISDSRRANALATMGWTVIGVTGNEILGVASTNTIADTVRKRLRKKPRPLPHDYVERQLLLRKQLGVTVGDWRAARS